MEFPQHWYRGHQEDDAKEQEEEPFIDPAGNDRTAHRAAGGPELEQHADSDVGQVVAHIGCRGAARRGDDGDDAGADCRVNVEAEAKGKQRDDKDSTADAHKRTENPGTDRGKEDDNNEDAD
jgi:hypothetical protein